MLPICRSCGLFETVALHLQRLAHTQGALMKTWHFALFCTLVAPGCEKAININNAGDLCNDEEVCEPGFVCIDRQCVQVCNIDADCTHGVARDRRIRNMFAFLGGSSSEARPGNVCTQDVAWVWWVRNMFGSWWGRSGQRLHPGRSAGSVVRNVFASVGRRSARVGPATSVTA